MAVTNNEEEIRRWAAARNAHPVQHKPIRPDGTPMQLGFVFGDPEQARDSLQPMAWDQFFAMFHMLGLVLRYDGDQVYELMKMQEETAPSWFEGKPMQA